MDDTELLASIGRYVQHIEVSPTKQTCKCVTEVIDQDKDLPKGMPRRLRVIDISLDCPIHTREGFILGYVDWMKRGK